jgi:hypothetical protein
MRHRAGKQLWILILSLTLLGSGVVTQPRQSWAADTPSDPSDPPPPDTGTGDPDWPTKRGMPSVNPRGQLTHEVSPVRSVWAAKWMWSIRMALATVSRVFLRF